MVHNLWRILYIACYIQILMIAKSQSSNLSESSAVEIDNLYLHLSQPGRNWNQAELAALKRRQAKLYRREIRETHRNHLKRNTQRYTEVSSIGGGKVPFDSELERKLYTN